jgi:hypothetical protein
MHNVKQMDKIKKKKKKQLLSLFIMTTWRVACRCPIEASNVENKSLIVTNNDGSLFSGSVINSSPTLSTST